MGDGLFLTQVQLPEGQEQEAPQVQSHPGAIYFDFKISDLSGRETDTTAE